MQLRPFFLPYSPECVEGLFSEVRVYGVLGSSSANFVLLRTYYSIAYTSADARSRLPSLYNFRRG